MVEEDRAREVRCRGEQWAQRINGKEGQIGRAGGCARRNDGDVVKERRKWIMRRRRSAREWEKG